MYDSNILILVKDGLEATACREALTKAGYPCVVTEDPATASGHLARGGTRLLIAEDRDEVRHWIENHPPTVPWLLLGEGSDTRRAVDALKAGAGDYLCRPLAMDMLVESVGRLLPTLSEIREGSLVAEDLRTRETLALAHRVAQTSATVLISGESGTGKEVFARYIHQHSGCAAGPFVAINCAAIPENMLESLLFGHEKGAFTGAYQATPGKFEQAQGGTLLLDEISEMNLDLQAKLLRVLQEREVERLGGRQTIPLDVRVLATTNRNLREEVAAGRFREDLFYRLNVFPLHLAPLRERPRDLLPLARFLIQKHVPPGRPLPRLAEDAQRALLAYSWPGNVRELDNLIQRALILSAGDAIRAADLMFEPGTEGIFTRAARDLAPSTAPRNPDPSRLIDDLKGMEERMILEALEAGNGSRKAAAERLGISPRTLRYKIARMREAGVPVP